MATGCSCTQLLHLQILMIPKRVRNTLLRLVTTVSVVEFTFVAVSAFLAVWANFNVTFRLQFQKLGQAWTIFTQGIIGRHEPNWRRI